MESIPDRLDAPASVHDRTTHVGPHAERAYASRALREARCAEAAEPQTRPTPHQTAVSFLRRDTPRRPPAVWTLPAGGDVSLLTGKYLR